MAHCPGETSGRHSTLSNTQQRYSIFTCAMGTAHRVTPNPTATVLCHGLINSEKQRFLKLVTTGTHCLYLKTQVGFRKAVTTNLYVFSSQGLETHTRPSRNLHEDAGSAFQTTGLGGERVSLESPDSLEGAAATQLPGTGPRGVCGHSDFEV